LNKKVLFYLAAIPAVNEIISSSDNLEERLDSAIEGLRNKE
jgi:hypothetical protein